MGHLALNKIAVRAREAFLEVLKSGLYFVHSFFVLSFSPTGCSVYILNHTQKNAFTIFELQDCQIVAGTYLIPLAISHIELRVPFSLSAQLLVNSAIPFKPKNSTSRGNDTAARSLPGISPPVAQIFTWLIVQKNSRDVCLKEKWFLFEACAMMAAYSVTLASPARWSNCNCVLSHKSLFLRWLISLSTEVIKGGFVFLWVKLQSCKTAIFF